MHQDILQCMYYTILPDFHGKCQLFLLGQQSFQSTSHSLPKRSAEHWACMACREQAPASSAPLLVLGAPQQGTPGAATPAPNFFSGPGTPSAAAAIPSSSPGLFGGSAFGMPGSAAAGGFFGSAALAPASLVRQPSVRKGKSRK
jgi:hypothetical protein